MATPSGQIHKIFVAAARPLTAEIRGNLPLGRSAGSRVYRYTSLHFDLGLLAKRQGRNAMQPADQRRLLTDVEAFCQELREHEELCYVEHRFNDRLIPLALKYNLLGMIVPQEYGGRGSDTVTYARALARINREGTGCRTFFSGHTSIGQYPVLTWGNEEQKQRYLPPSCRGEKIFAFGLTEPEAGSNPLEMQMTYRREGNRFVLNGVKYLISNAGIATTIVAFAYPESSPHAPRADSGTRSVP